MSPVHFWLLLLSKFQYLFSDDRSCEAATATWDTPYTCFHFFALLQLFREHTTD